MPLCKWCRGWLTIFKLGKNNKLVYRCVACGRHQDGS